MLWEGLSELEQCVQDSKECSQSALCRLTLTVLIPQIKFHLSLLASRIDIGTNPGSKNYQLSLANCYKH